MIELDIQRIKPAGASHDSKLALALMQSVFDQKQEEILSQFEKEHCK